VKLQTPDDGVKQQDTPAFGAKGGSHLVRASLDFFKKPLNDMVSADRLPVLTRESIQG